MIAKAQKVKSSPAAVREYSGPKGELREIEVSKIELPVDDLREEVTAEEIDELAATLKSHSLLQPILVRPIGTGDRFVVVAGARRFRAVQVLKWRRVAVVSRPMTDVEAAEVGLMENLQRKDLSVLETARSLRRLYEQLNADGGQVSEETLAKRFGHSQAWINNHFRALRLPAKPWLDRLRSGELTLTHLKFLFPYAEQPHVLAAIDKVYREQPGWYRDWKSFRKLVDDVARQDRSVVNRGRRWREDPAVEVDVDDDIDDRVAGPGPAIAARSAAAVTTTKSLAPVMPKGHEIDRGEVVRVVVKRIGEMSLDEISEVEAACKARRAEFGS